MKLAHAYAAATIFLLGCIGVGHYVNVPTLRPTPQLQLQYIPSVTNLNFFAATDMLVDHGVRMYTPRAIPSTNRQNTVITEPPTTSSASEGAIREAIATTVFENIDSNPRLPLRKQARRRRLTHIPDAARAREAVRDPGSHLLETLERAHTHRNATYTSAILPARQQQPKSFTAGTAAIAIRGERHSGTNWLKAIIRQNCKGLWQNFKSRPVRLTSFDYMYNIVLLFIRLYMRRRVRRI